jgi:hypothetical protein
MKSPLLAAIVLTLGGLLVADPVRAAESDFVFKAAYRNVNTDPDEIWFGDALASGNVSIFEYRLRGRGGDLVVSQIWNDDCSSNTCPTRLVRLDTSGRRNILLDDMMRQVIPPNDPNFAGLPKSGPQAEYAQHPFRLSADGETLLNGDFKFKLDEVRP